MDQRKKERIIDFLLNKGTGYEDVFNSDPEAKWFYIEECKKFLCDCYLAGELSDEERRNFEKMLSEDARLQKQLELQSSLEDFLNIEAPLLSYMVEADKLVENSYENHKVTRSIKKSIRSFNQQLKANTNAVFTLALPIKKIRLNGLRENGNWVAAASIAFLIVFTTIFSIKRYSHTSDQDLFTHYYHPYTEVFDHSSGSHHIYDAKKKYLAGKYEQSYQLYRKLYKEKIEVDQEISFFYALTMIELNMYTDAIKHLSNFRDTYRYSKFYPYASWYLTLCYMKTDQMDQATPILSLLASYAGPKSKEAKELLESIAEYSSDQEQH